MVTEIKRGACNSSFAFLAAQPKRLISYDSVIERGADLLLHFRGQTDVKLVQEESHSARIDPTDLLFIDSLHTYDQVRLELLNNHLQVRKFIVFHDTKTFGIKGEGQEDGILRAINEFMAAQPSWETIYQSDQSHGLMILHRQGSVAGHQPKAS